MSKKYKSKVKFNKKKPSKKIKYNTGGRLNARNTREEASGFYSLGEGEETDPSAGNIASTVGKASGDIINTASDFVKMPSMEKFTNTDFGGTQGQEYADKAAKAQRTGSIASKTLGAAAAASLAIPVAGPFISAGLGIASGFAKLGGNIRAKRQASKAQDFGDSWEKKEENKEMQNDYLSSIGEQTFQNGGDSIKYSDGVAKLDSTSGYNAGLDGTSAEGVERLQNKLAMWARYNNFDKLDYTSEELYNYQKGVNAALKGNKLLPGKSAMVPYQNGGKESNSNSELTKFFGPSHDKGGIDIGGNKEVQGGETAKDGFIFSGGKNGIGYDKKGKPTFDPKKTKVTFADKTKKIDKIFSDRNDTISNRTKEMLYSKVEADNRKMGPIADAKNGIPKTEGKFLYGGDEDGVTRKNYREAQQEMTPEAFSEFVYGKNSIPELSLNSKTPEPNMEGLYDAKKVEVPHIYDKNVIPNKKGLHTDSKKITTDSRNNTTGTDSTSVGFGPGDKLNMLSSLPAIGYNLGQGFKKAEKENLQLNPEAANIKRLMADRKINFQALENELTKERTKGAMDIGNNTRSVGSRNANLQALYANVADKKAGLRLQEQDANNRYRGEEANVLNSLGAQESQERIRKNTVDSQNRAMKQNFLGQAAVEGGEGAKNLANAFNANAKNNLTVSAVNALSTKYGVNVNTINRLIRQGYSGDALESELVKYKG